MKKESIRNHLKTYSIYQKRKTTINHAFASAIAPVDCYDNNIEKIDEAMRHLNQEEGGNLVCVYCSNPAETWDHLIGLVKNGNLYGFGHQIGNLVPCCKNCNSAKGNKLPEQFIMNSDIENKDMLIDLINTYQNNFAIEINLALWQDTCSEDFEKYNKIKNEILELMKEADRVAERIREKF